MSPVQRIALTVVAVAMVATATIRTRADTVPDFESQVEPIFARHCVACHGARRQRGGLRLDNPASVFGEADSGYPSVVPGDVDKSELMRRILSDDGDRMPPEGHPLSTKEIGMLRRWIESGARWPDSAEHPKTSSGELTVTDEDRRFWAFAPLTQVEVPAVNSTLARNPIDQLALGDSVVERHRAQGEPGVKNPAIGVTGRLALQRRMFFDVIGLPPTESDVLSVESNPEAFDADELAERLLASRHFGERWARHWLDVARYADSNGYENDLDRPHAYQYRDFVIRAFNRDMPFDRFVRWQVAGDELAPDNPMAVAATGFLAAGPLNRSAPVAPDEVLKKIRFDELDDIVATTSQAFLGLTLACARCHDHKFDPIPTRDYYRLVSTFATATRRESDLRFEQRQLDLWVKQSKRKLLEQKVAALDCSEDERKWLLVGPMNPAESKRAFRDFGEAIAFTDQQWRGTLSEKDQRTLSRLEAAVQRAESDGRGSSQRSWATQPALFVTDQSNQAIPIFVLQRGDVGLPGDPAPPGILTVLQKGRPFEKYLAERAGRHDADTTGNRSAMAAWLTDVENGAGHLVARVIVNRLWHHYFGTGLVSTPNDFGTQGARPSRPELLDWLAAELIRNDWQVKSIHRHILQSNSYRNQIVQSSRSSMRLDSEATRDAILAASGRLNRKMFGPGIRPYVPTAAMATRSGDKWPEDVQEDANHFRRSLYIFVKRSIRFPMMEAFDSPDPTTSCGRRIATTVPVQALTLMNDPSVRNAAIDFAESLILQHPVSDSQPRIKSAFRRAIGRPPSSDELMRATAFLDDSDTGDSLVDLCHALFLSNEFVYVE